MRFFSSVYQAVVNSMKLYQFISLYEINFVRGRKMSFSFIRTTQDILLPLLLLASGIYATASIGLFHVKHPIKSLKIALRHTDGKGNSPLKAMCLALAGTIGVGNIAGVALAIGIGGAGAVFWMWISALLVMSVKYAEIVLAVKYRKGNSGGAMYYMRDGIGGKLGSILAVIFALLCLLDSVAIGGAVQVSAVSETLHGELGISPIVSGAVVAVLCAIIVFGRVKRISSLTMKLVPAMSALYVGMSLFVIIPCYDRIPSLLGEIFSSAFCIDSGIGGIAGFLVASGMKSGVSCGLMSNEAGCGTAPIAHASSNAKSPAQQGIWGMIEVFLDTIVICTMTAFVILLSGIDTSTAHGAALTAAAYRVCLGDIAGYLICICVSLFAFATVICWSYYGTVALSYLTKSKKATSAYLTSFCILLFVGAVAMPSSVWDMTDTIITVMTLINLFCVIALMPEVRAITRAELPFFKKKDRGFTPASNAGVKARSGMQN
jgi:AGCS family alanine or glycine:cation symporter